LQNLVAKFAIINVILLIRAHMGNICAIFKIARTDSAYGIFIFPRELSEQNNGTENKAMWSEKDGFF